MKRNRTFSFIDIELPDEQKEALQKISATSVYDMGLSEKTSNSLWRFFICNIGQILNFRSAADIKKIRNIGAKGAKEIAESLEQYGVCNDAWRTFLRKYNPPSTSINLVCLQILTVQICKARRLLYIMKATGIVRRIEECVIIGQTA